MAPILPEQIYKAGRLGAAGRHRAVGAQNHAARDQPRRQNRAHVLCDVLSALPHRLVVRAHHQSRPRARHLDLHPPDRLRRHAQKVPEKGRRGAEPDHDPRRKGPGARPGARHRLPRPRRLCATSSSRRRRNIFDVGVYITIYGSVDRGARQGRERDKIDARVAAGLCQAGALPAGAGLSLGAAARHATSSA